MQKTYELTKEEFIRMQQESRELPGCLGVWPLLYHLFVILAGLYFFFRCAICGIELTQGLLDAEGFSGYWNAVGRHTLIEFLLYLALTLFCAWLLFFAEKRRILRRFEQNAAWIRTGRTMLWEDGTLQLSRPGSESSWQMGPAHTVFLTDTFFYGTLREGRRKRRLLWSVPRRIFGQEEEEIFLRELRACCPVRTLRGELTIQPKRSDLTVLAASLGLLLFSFSWELVMLQEEAVRWSLHGWIAAMLLMVPSLLGLLYASIRLMRCSAGTPYRRFALLWLTAAAAAILMWIPVGAALDLILFWNAWMLLVCVLSLRALWLLSGGLGRLPGTFRKCLALIALVQLGWALYHLAVFLFQLPGAGLTLKSFYEAASDAAAADPHTGRASSAVLSCAWRWFVGTVSGACGACLSLLCAGVVSVCHNKKTLPRLLAALGVFVLLFLCRRCGSPLAFALWTAALIALSVLCVLEVRKKAK